MTTTTELLPMLVSKDRRSVILTDGSTVPVTNWIDYATDDLDFDDPIEEIAVVVAGYEGFGYFAVSLDDLPDPTLH